MDFVKSKQRIADHGEVFTPPEVVIAMLDLVSGESARIDSRFLEPACGSGNFLVPVLERKLDTVLSRYGASDFERKHQSLLALMSIYGVELLADNVTECRANLLAVCAGRLDLLADDEWRGAAEVVLTLNIVHGNALSMTTEGGSPQAILLPEWSYLGKGRYQRRDFRFDVLTQASAYGSEDSLFAESAHDEIFKPERVYQPMSVRQISEWLGQE